VWAEPLPRKKERKKVRTEQNNNPFARKSIKECKCGSKEHQQITSLKCLWKGLCQENVAQNYADRLEEMQLSAGQPTTTESTGNLTTDAEEQVKSSH
jgi:hypothetical protein